MFTAFCFLLGDLVFKTFLNIKQHLVVVIIIKSSTFTELVRSDEFVIRNSCGLVPLELRCIWADLIVCYKIVHKHVDLPMEDYSKLSTCNRTRGHKFKLSIPVYFNNVRRHYFVNRVVPIWNSLSFEIVNLSNVLSFKNRIKYVSLDKFLMRNYSI